MSRVNTKWVNSNMPRVNTKWVNSNMPRVNTKWVNPNMPYTSMDNRIKHLQRKKEELERRKTTRETTAQAPQNPYQQPYQAPTRPVGGGGSDPNGFQNPFLDGGGGAGGGGGGQARPQVPTRPGFGTPIISRQDRAWGERQALEDRFGYKPDWNTQDYLDDPEYRAGLQELDDHYGNEMFDDWNWEAPRRYVHRGPGKQPYQAPSNNAPVNPSIQGGGGGGSDPNRFQNPFLDGGGGGGGGGGQGPLIEMSDQERWRAGTGGGFLGAQKWKAYQEQQKRMKPSPPGNSFAPAPAGQLPQQQQPYQAPSIQLPTPQYSQGSQTSSLSPPQVQAQQANVFSQYQQQPYQAQQAQKPSASQVQTANARNPGNQYGFGLGNQARPGGNGQQQQPYNAPR